MKVLYVNHDFPPMSGPAVWRALWFIRYLTEEGFELPALGGAGPDWRERYDRSLVDLIPADVRVARLRDFFPEDILALPERRLSKKRWRIIRPLYFKVRWTLNRYYPDPNLWWMIKACCRGVALARSQRVDCVVTSGPPHVIHVVGLVVKKCSGAAWIVDYRDLWTDDPWQSPTGRRQKRLFRRLEAACAERADAVVAVSPFWLNLLKDRHAAGREDDRFRLIRNGHNIDVSSAPDASQAVGERAEARLTIHYNGTPQYHSETPNLTEALSRMASSPIPVEHLPQLTFTGMSETFSTTIRERNLHEFVADVGALGYEEGIDRSKRADALLVIVNNDHDIRRGIIPAKAYEAIALGKHVLAIVPFESDVKDLLTEYGNATICDVDDPDDICRGFASVMSLRDKSRLDNPNSESWRDFALQFSRRRLAEQLAELIRSLVPIKPRPLDAELARQSSETPDEIRE
jgi:glycosyltransferase involved in cell wall biosynthesis